jgi:hypothetical protein
MLEGAETAPVVRLCSCVLQLSCQNVNPLYFWIFEERERREENLEAENSVDENKRPLVLVVFFHGDVAASAFDNSVAGSGRTFNFGRSGPLTSTAEP